MSTLEKISEEAVNAIKKAGRGEKLSQNEIEVMKIYTSLNGKKAWNAGKRKVIKTGN